MITEFHKTIMYCQTTSNFTGIRPSQLFHNVGVAQRKATNVKTDWATLDNR